MKYILIFVFTIFLMSDSFGQDEVIKNGYQKFFYPNGKVASEGTMRDGKPDAFWKTYYKNGILKSEGNRLNFELDSIWNFYTLEGNLKLSVDYKNGKKNGYRRTYLPNRILVDSFLNNVKNYTNFVLYKDSLVKSTVFYIDGLEEGWSIDYAKDGRIVGKTLYSHGFVKSRENINAYDYDGEKDGVWKIFYESGIDKIVGRYRGGIKEGYFKYYNTKGNLDSIEKYHNDLLVLETPELDSYDIKKDYYSDGSIKIIGSYKDGKAEGVRREYNKDGSITSSFIMHKGSILAKGILDNSGNKQGDWIYYHPNGSIESKGKFANNIKVGPWIYYFDNGKIQQTGSYDKSGIVSGEWKWYYKDGSKRIVEQYFEGEREGQFLELAADGSTIIEGEYVNGLREGYWVITVGKYTEKGSYLESIKDGVWEYYYTADTLFFKGNFIDGTPDGEHVWYHRNSKVLKEGKYIMGLREGVWKFYNEDGKLQLRIKYLDGVEIEYNAVRVQGIEGNKGEE